MTPRDFHRLHPDEYEFLWRTLLRKEYGMSYRRLDAHGIDCMIGRVACQIYHHQGGTWPVVQGKFRDDLSAAQLVRADHPFDEWRFITTFAFKTETHQQWLAAQQAALPPGLVVSTWGDEDLADYVARYPHIGLMLMAPDSRAVAAPPGPATPAPSAPPPVVSESGVAILKALLVAPSDRLDYATIPDILAQDASFTDPGTLAVSLQLSDAKELALVVHGLEMNGLVATWDSDLTDWVDGHECFGKQVRITSEGKSWLVRNPNTFQR